ncbi:hypothetical protein AGMMS49546_04610 [Spirochaetia bacterium]|nr:hypothetical protein AGMMS49546_04610 [Spirochaetia bacterium]
MASISKLKDMKTRTGTQDSHSVNGMVKDIAIGDIQIKGNVRQDYTDIDELAASIRQHGLLQPITVYKEGDEFLIKTGHRRFKACQQLYQTEPDRFQNIRCIISNAENIAVIQLVENVQREDLTSRELYDAYFILRQQGYSHKEIADMTGKSIQWVDKIYTYINEIGENPILLEHITSAGGSMEDIAETKGIPDKEARLNLLEQRRNGEITRAEMRHEAKALKGDDPAKKEVPIISTKPQTLPSSPRSAFTIAKERLDQYISDMVEDTWDDLALWEFYTWLLEQAKRHAVDRSGFISEEYKSDKERAGK